MDGILIIDKPAGITSHDVVARVRRVLQTRRVGHTGTLDPFATGVMVILVGRATRLAQFLDKDEKEYEAVVRFGFETDTGDVTGTPKDLSAAGPAQAGPLDEGPHAAGISEKLASIDWPQVLSRFRGEIEQVPPMYSAKKVAGKKLYEHARKGEVLERTPLKVTISKLDLLGTDDDAIRIRVVCSAGTYIRTLAEDIGRAIDIGAHLSQLRRTRAGRFDITDAVTLDELGGMDDPSKQLLPMTAAVEHLPELRLTAERIEKTRNGLSTRVETEAFAAGEAVRMIDTDGALVAIGAFEKGEDVVRPKVVLV
jgi:tRNA pseudouridine55 synthase